MSSVVYDKLCADVLTFFLFFRLAVLLECHIPVVSFDAKKFSLRSRLSCLRDRLSSSCFDMLLLLSSSSSSSFFPFYLLP